MPLNYQPEVPSDSVIFVDNLSKMRTVLQKTKLNNDLVGMSPTCQITFHLTSTIQAYIVNLLSIFKVNSYNTHNLYSFCHLFSWPSVDHADKGVLLDL